MSDTVAAGQLRSFVDRVLRLKEEQDNISKDIRDIYAEAKGVGFDKTALGQVVAHVRKVGKLGVSAVEEKQTIFDLYLDAYERGAVGTRVATHAHEQVDRAARARQRTSEAMDDNKAFSQELLDAGLITEEAHAENVAISDGVARKYGAGVIDPQSGEIQDPQSSHGTPPQVAAIAGEVSPSASPAPISNADVPAFLLKDRKPLRPLCQNPSNCAGYGSHTCHSCLKEAGTNSEAQP